MNQLRLIIEKKFYAPSKYQINHKYHAKYVQIAQITPEQSPLYFKGISGQGNLVNDAQFAKLLFDNYGVGEYLIMASMKGRKGFWHFIRIQCREDRFIRLEKKKTQEQKELVEQKTEYRKLQMQLMSADDAEERESVQRELRSMEEDIGINKSIVKLEKTNKSCYPWLKLVSRVGVEQEYESYNGSNQQVVEQVEEADRIWYKENLINLILEKLGH
jgi:hypothetical protein